MATRKRPPITEESMQVAVVNWLHLQHPAVWERTHHSPNGGARNAATGARLKLMGTRRGWPDLVVMVPRRKWCGLALELKAEGGRLSVEQNQWLEWLHECGFLVGVAWSFDEAISAITAYLGTGRRG
jgi:hypothetical protein